MSELEWPVAGGIVALALAGLMWITAGRILGWHRERSREPLRAPFKLQEFPGSEGVTSVPATEDGSAGRRQQRPANTEAQGPATSKWLAPPAARAGEAGSKGIASAKSPAAPGDLCPGNGPRGLPEDQEPAGVEAAEQQLRQLQVRLNRELGRFEQLTDASGDELTRALLKHGVTSVADLPQPAALEVRQQAEALQRLSGELDPMERNVKRKALELVDPRRVLRRSTESGWGRKPGASAWRRRAYRGEACDPKGVKPPPRSLRGAGPHLSLRGATLRG
jgi:hypothetical protein